MSIGIDIARVSLLKSNRSNCDREGISEFFSIMSNQFTAYEWQYIHSGHHDHTTGHITHATDQLERYILSAASAQWHCVFVRFFELWTVKEAILKCIGVGLYIEPKDVHLLNLDHVTDVHVPAVRPVKLGSYVLDSKCLCGYKYAIPTYPGGNNSEGCIVTMRLLRPDSPKYMFSICLASREYCDESWTSLVTATDKYQLAVNFSNDSEPTASTSIDFVSPESNRRISIHCDFVDFPPVSS